MGGAWSKLSTPGRYMDVQVGGKLCMFGIQGGICRFKRVVRGAICVFRGHIWMSEFAVRGVFVAFQGDMKV